MLSLSQSEPMKIAAANLMLRSALRSFPVAPELARIAEQKSRAIGVATFDPHQVGGRFKTLAKYIGWRRAAALRYRYTILRKKLSRILVDRGIGYTNVHAKDAGTAQDSGSETLTYHVKPLRLR